MKTHGGVEVQLHVFLTSALDGFELSASFSGCFIETVNFLANRVTINF